MEKAELLFVHAGNAWAFHAVAISAGVDGYSSGSTFFGAYPVGAVVRNHAYTGVTAAVEILAVGTAAPDPVAVTVKVAPFQYSAAVLVIETVPTLDAAGQVGAITVTAALSERLQPSTTDATMT